MNSGGWSVAQTRAEIRAAAVAFVEALRSYSSEHHPVLVTTALTTERLRAAVTGLSPRLAPVGTSTVPGRDTTNAPSRLFSSSLGLDVSSPERASVLLSDALGLDLTSPDAASYLESARTLGLDVTSHERVSTLSSSAALELNNTGAASVLVSTGEMNSAATAYGSAQLSFTGSSGPTSTSTATLSGAYAGVNSAASASSLTVTVKGTAHLNRLLPARVAFEVRDQEGTLLFAFDGFVRPDTQISMGPDIGLSIAFSAGRLSNKHSASTTVTHDPAVDVDAAFNHTNPAARPQFDGAAEVVAGSFSINGVPIAVNANDSINSVLARITQSAAGVTARVDGDRVRLTTTMDSESDIVLTGDTSGFLRATKLFGASTVRGNLADAQQAFAKTSAFGHVTAGSFNINGVAIAVDPTVDSVIDVVSRINAAKAGVDAHYDSVRDRISLSSVSNSEEDLVVDHDSTGFLAAAALATSNTIRGNIHDDGQALARTSQFSAVRSGAFTINGVTITVNAAVDSLDSILSRITASAAGVTARYDADADRVQLQSKTASMDRIVVDDDSSGFLAIAGLDSANTVRGQVREDETALANLDRFRSVTDGTFVVDGHVIAVAADRDSMRTIVDKINRSGARVSARYDADIGRIVVDSKGPSEDELAIGSDTSGFLVSAGLDPSRTTRGIVRDDRQVLAKTAQFSSVTNGSFLVNGRTIIVEANRDSLADIVAKINDADAGVTASLEDDRLQLESNEFSDKDIAVGSDTSGWLAAAGLHTSNTQRGSVPASERSAFDTVLADMAEFASVRRGDLVVNGRRIAIDPQTTTLRDALEAMRVAGVRTALDERTGRVTVTAASLEERLELSDTSGLLESLGLTAGVFNPSGGERIVTQKAVGTKLVSNAREVVSDLASAVERLNAALAELANDPAKRRIESALEKALAALGGIGAGIRAGDGADFRVAVDAGLLEQALETSRIDLGSAPELDATLSAWVREMAEIADGDSGPSSLPLALDDSNNARLLADRAAAVLVVPGPVTQIGPPDAATLKRAAEAYGDKTLFAEARDALGLKPEALANLLFEGLFPERPENERAGLTGPRYRPPGVSDET